MTMELTPEVKQSMKNLSIAVANRDQIYLLIRHIFLTHKQQIIEWLKAQGKGVK